MIIVRMRKAYRDMGAAIAEFQVNEETASAAAAAGDAIIYGAPNVVRGGSHTGWTKASDMIAKGLCSVLASDYYYPARGRFSTRGAPSRASRPMRWRPVQRDPRAVLGAVKAWPSSMDARGKAARRPALTAPVHGAPARAGRDEGTAARHEQRNSHEMRSYR